MNTKENNTPQEEEVVKNPEAETAQTQNGRSIKRTRSSRGTDSRTTVEQRP